MNEYYLRHEGVVSRSISAENFTGEKGRGGMSVDGAARGCAKELGQGWKVSPAVVIKPGELFTLADIRGSGIVNHFWVTYTLDDVNLSRKAALRIYWDECDVPAVECPLGDFFASAHETYYQISSSVVCANPRKGYNCYWKMPFRKGCRMTVENTGDKPMILYYQVDYVLCDVPADATYFHAQFRRVNPVPPKTVFTVLDNVHGHGTYVGTYMVYGTHEDGVWCEGEMKFYLDGDTDFPTVCGTGTEDYFGAAYSGEVDGKTVPFSTPYSGIFQWPEQLAGSVTRRFSLYRFHTEDPIFFDRDIRVTVQALGWYPTWLYKTLEDDLSAVAFFYLDDPAGDLPPYPTNEQLEIR